METIKNSYHELKFVDINDDGFGVSKMDDGKVVFVPYVIDGEVAKVKIISDKKSYCYGKLESVVNTSVKRRQPPCPYFYKCGGCDIEHLNRDYQLEFKTKKVKNAFNKIAGIDVDVSLCKGGEEFRYRNKVAMPISSSGRLGLYRKNSHDIIEVEDCLITRDWIKDLILEVNNFIKISGETIYNEKTNKGLFRHVVAREVDNKLLITFVINGNKINKIDKFCLNFAKKYQNFAVNININKKTGNVILGDKWVDVYGNGFIESEKYGVKFQVSNASFFQVNDKIRDKVYEEILNEIEPNETVIDAYSGAGMLTSFIAKKAKKVIGVEIIKEATIDANKLKQNNNISNMENINGDCAEVLPELVKKLGSDDLSIVIDPPRKGADIKVINSIVKVSPKKIIYLSCNPNTLARDSKYLLDVDYEIKFIKPFDMFPNTSHVETLAVFTLNK